MMPTNSKLEKNTSCYIILFEGKCGIINKVENMNLCLVNKLKYTLKYNKKIDTFKKVHFHDQIVNFNPTSTGSF